jgi:hypothetical protein
MGNLIKGEWSQQIDNNSGDESVLNEEDSKIKKSGNLIRRKLSNLMINANVGGDQYSRVNSTDSSSTPVTNKVISHDFDPRSPSNGIVRTPIAFEEKQKSKKFSLVDPRSPTLEYNRTPIRMNAAADSATKQQNGDMLNQSKDSTDTNLLNESAFSQDSSLLLMADSSPVMQSVPEASSGELSSLQIADAANQLNGLKVTSSNMPRHILQRKQVEKLNKKKLSDIKDKENNGNSLI